MLRTHKLGEADRIITLLTRQHGRVRAVAKGVRRTTSKFGSRLEPFTHVDLQLAEGRSLDTITQAETQRRSPPRSGRLRPLHLRHRDARDRRAAGRRGAGARRPAVPAAASAHSARWRRGSTAPGRCSTPTCCARSPVAGYAPSFEACAHCGRAGPHRWFNPSMGGVLCATCRVPGSASPAPETSVLLGAPARRRLAGRRRRRAAPPPEASGLVAAYSSVAPGARACGRWRTSSASPRLDCAPHQRNARVTSRPTPHPSRRRGRRPSLRSWCRGTSRS